MFSEKDFEDIICKWPELIEDGLILKGRQITLFGRRLDILFEDKFKRKLIIELKVGPIKDEDIGQILSYEGMLLSSEDPTIRIMLVGNRVPPNIQRSLDHHGIAWKAITFLELKEFLNSKNDVTFLKLFNDEVVKIQSSAKLLDEGRKNNVIDKAVTAGDFEYQGNGKYVLKLDSLIQIDVNESCRVIEEVFNKHGFQAQNINGLRYQLRNQAGLINQKINPRDRAGKIKVSGRDFEHVGDGIFIYSKDEGVRLDLKMPGREVEYQLTSHNLWTKNLWGFYWKLRTRAGLIEA